MYSHYILDNKQLTMNVFIRIQGTFLRSWQNQYNTKLTKVHNDNKINTKKNK